MIGIGVLASIAVALAIVLTSGRRIVRPIVSLAAAAHSDHLVAQPAIFQSEVTAQFFQIQVHPEAGGIVRQHTLRAVEDLAAQRWHADGLVRLG